jgi:hypothetical protein
MNDGTLAENCYLNIHTKTCDYAEVLQPGGDERWLLPEILITSLTTTIFVAFLNGFFGELGKDLYEKLKKKVTRGRVLEHCEPKEMINELANKMPELRHLDERFSNGEKAIKIRLIKLQFSEDKAQQFAREVITTIKETVSND